MNLVQKKITTLAQRIITGTILATAGYCIFFFLPPWCFSLMLVIIAILIIVYELPRLIPFRGILFWCIAFLYPLLSFLMMLILNHTPQYRPFLFLIFLTVCCTDIGAYVAGNLFGKHTIAPRISPKKTWEGFFGGFLFCCGALFLFTKMYATPIDIQFFLLFSFFITTTATCGDFFESWLKRSAGIKDSGALLPGHGGLLDRFDSILFVTIVIFLLKTALFKKFF